MAAGPGAASPAEQEASVARAVSSRRMFVTVLLRVTEMSCKLRVEGKRLQYPTLIASFVAINGSFG